MSLIRKIIVIFAVIMIGTLPFVLIANENISTSVGFLALAVCCGIVVLLVCKYWKEFLD